MTHDQNPRCRVIHVCSGDTWAGAEQQVFNLAEAQHRKQPGMVQVLTFNEGVLAERLRAAGVKTSVLNEAVLSTPQLLRSLIRRFRCIGPEVVQTHGYKEHILGAIAARLSGKTTCIRTIHGAPEHRSPGWRGHLTRWLDGYVAQHLQLEWVTVSEDLASQVEQSLGTRPRVIANSVARVLLNEPAQPASTSAVKRIVFVGRITRVKRVDRVLDIARLAMSSGRAYHFDIVGDGPLRAELEPKSPENVSWHGFQQNPAAFISRADVLLLTSDHEGQPTVVLESTAMGRPVVAPNVGGLPELTRDAAVHLVNSQNAEDYLAQIDRALENQTTLTGPSESWLLRHHPDAQAARYERVLTALQPVALRRQSAPSLTSPYHAREAN